MTSSPPAAGREKPEARYNVPALEKGLEILELLARMPTPLTLTAISSELQRSTGEVYRILQFLDHSDYIVRNREGDTYALSMKMFHLSHAQPPLRSLTSAAVPIMEDLAVKAGQSCHLAVLSRTNITIVANITSPLPLTYGVRLGAQFPAWETSSGILLCAFQAEAQRRTLFASLTQIIDEAAMANLRAKMDQVVAAGFEERPSLRIPGILNISFPVRDRLGNVVAALTVPYLPQRSAVTTLEEVRVLVGQSAVALSQALGYRGVDESNP
jgi:DNA-binding IclR family transcriptional regulator